MALDLLFKTYYVLDINCPKILIYFFNFLQNYCFKISANVKYSLVSLTYINISKVIL